MTCAHGMTADGMARGSLTVCGACGAVLRLEAGGRLDAVDLEALALSPVERELLLQMVAEVAAWMRVSRWL